MKAKFKKMTPAQVKEKQNATMRKQLLDIIDNLEKANKGEVSLDG